jgi:hypothetical protein
VHVCTSSLCQISQATLTNDKRIGNSFEKYNIVCMSINNANLVFSMTWFLVFSMTLLKTYCNMKIWYLFWGERSVRFSACTTLSIEDFKTRFHTYTFNYQYQIKSNLVAIRRLNHKLNCIFFRVDILLFKNNVK